METLEQIEALEKATKESMRSQSSFHKAKNAMSELGYGTLQELGYDLIQLGVVSDKGKVWTRIKRGRFPADGVIISKVSARFYGMEIVE